MSALPRLAVLVSGRGSHLQAILDAISARELDAEIAGVFSDKPRAEALLKVERRLRWSAKPKDFADRDAFDAALGDAVEAAKPDWVVCAGYMRILGDAFVRRFDGKLLNIHPSLLPKYKGLHTHRRALDAGDAEHGASVHFVVPELDAGAVIAQARIPIEPGDSPETLARRLLPREHALYAAVLRLAVAGRLAERNGVVFVDAQPIFTPLQLDSAGNLSAPPTESR